MLLGNIIYFHSDSLRLGLALMLEVTLQRTSAFHSGGSRNTSTCSCLMLQYGNRDTVSSSGKNQI